jgi:hypothetical protein
MATPLFFFTWAILSIPPLCSTLNPRAMKIPAQLVKETYVTMQEDSNAALFYLYLNTFYPLLMMNDAATAPIIIFIQCRFCIPRTVISPALCLKLNATIEVDCQQYFPSDHGDIRKLIVQYSWSSQRPKNLQLMLIGFLSQRWRYNWNNIPYYYYYY